MRMSPRLLSSLLSALVLLGLGSPVLAEAEEWRVQAADRVEVVADFEAAPGVTSGPIVVLLHQGGGDARGEYASHQERLHRLGYSTLSVDLRRGGSDRFGSENRTVAGLPDGAEYDYCDPLLDIEAILAELGTRQPNRPIVLWGSSFSAALAVITASRHPSQVSAVLAFSPASGPPMGACQPDPYLSQLTRPWLIARPSRELQLPSAARQWRAAQAAGAWTLTGNGPHGSSLLVEERGGTDSQALWQQVNRFLFAAAPPASRRIEIESSTWRLVGDYQTTGNPEPQAAVLLLHSAASRRDRFEPLARALAAQGIASLRLDLRGHGESIDQGRFDPSRLPETRHTIVDAPEDVAAALAWLRARSDVDPHRIGVLGSSYSGESMAVAARQGAAARAYVALSPGSFSDESIAWIDSSDTEWWFVRSSREPPFFDDLFAAIEAGSERAEVEQLETHGHGDRLLTTTPRLEPEIVEWFAWFLRESSN